MIEFQEEQNLTDSTGPDMTPMIDMVFLLLIFFLLTSLVMQPVLNVVLPKAATAETEKDLTITLGIDKDHVLYFNGEPVAEEDLRLKLISALESSENNTVTIQSDESVDFGKVVMLMDIARKSGAGAVSFLVKKE
jgi:biopolymer transport protein ExbD